MVSWRLFLVIVAVGCALLAFPGCQPEKPAKSTTKPSAKPALAEGLMPETFFPERLAEIGPSACVKCHADAVHDWEGTHHALANRPVNSTLDSAAFTPTRTFTDAGVTTTLSKQAGKFVIKVNEADGSVSQHELTGVIATDPLRQYLAPFPKGQWQTTSAAYDPKLHEWFEVFSGEGRLPGEWGHWTGQGMNWNANCAACHMTEFKKNFDWRSGHYQSTWLQQGIACAQCHDGLETHVREAAKPGYTAPPSLKMSSAQIMDNCASCHSRRGQLTADKFSPGERYHDHYELSLPDQPGLYYHDGQIRDEDFVYGSFMMSRMGHAGVTCLDCHNPHTLKTILPANNNQLCMRCHESGVDQAPIIQPEAHSHHAAGSAGNLCVECHMPETTYMMRDPRRDHGFLSPDPLLTLELGIPNACNRCHADESTEWAVDWAEKWYGEQLAAKPQRARARALAAAHEGVPDAHEALLALAAEEDVPAWRATYAGLLGGWAHEQAVVDYLAGLQTDESPLVRNRAARSLGWTPQGASLWRGDDSRSVRIAVAFATLGREAMTEDEVAEWLEFQEFNSDRPQNAFILAERLSALGGSEQDIRLLVDRAVELDRASAEVHLQASVFYSRLGDSEATEAALLESLRIDPQHVQALYYLALFRAEQGNFSEAISLLTDVVALEPGFERAWFNLALAYTKIGEWQKAAEALQRTPSLQGSPQWRQTMSVVQRQLGQ
ncbi:tetratricopeptide repeat protein [Cerasicoccus frondis]|uniref:tetratricopeptide repeat protein n=1 Tax=Cerasicoccus frondis TaxID=490090 RepID=UPI0028527789|nr:tetratricopeptide repeat protein [Cerasicoccus frondis]